jgi:hypothetical protein
LLHPDVKIGFTRFVEFMPYYVKSVTENQRMTCCCQIHTEAKFVFDALYRWALRLVKVYDPDRFKDLTSNAPVRQRRAAAAGARHATAAVTSTVCAAATTEDHLNALRPLFRSKGSIRLFFDDRAMPDPDAPDADDEDFVMCKAIQFRDELRRYSPLECIHGACATQHVEERCGEPRVQKILDALIALSDGAGEDVRIAYVGYEKDDAPTGKDNKSAPQLRQKRFENVAPDVFKDVVLATFFGTPSETQAANVGSKRNKYFTGPKARAYRTGFVHHHHESRFMGDQMADDVSSFPLHEIRIGTDFAMNISLENHTALQSEFYCPQQVTLYSCVIWYHAKGSTEEHPIIETMHYHVISDDLKHDAWAVVAFHDAIFADLKKRGVEFDRCVWWSDGASAHFKSAPAFATLAKHEMFQVGKGRGGGTVKLVRMFGATGHMKGPWDGANTFVKNSVKKHMYTAAARFGDEGIRDAHEVYEFLEKNASEVKGNGSVKTSVKEKTKLDERVFLYVETGDVKRPEKVQEGKKPMFQVVERRVQPLHELRMDLSAAVWRLDGRDYGCACKVCRGAQGACRYERWVPRLKQVVLKFSKEGKVEMGCTCRAGRKCKVCGFTEKQRDKQG